MELYAEVISKVQLGNTPPPPDPHPAPRRPKGHSDNPTGGHSDNPTGQTVTSEAVNLFYEAPILAAVEVKKIRVAADTGACAHCTGPDDLPHDVVVEQVEQRNFVGPNGQAIDHFGEAAIRLEQADGSHVSMRTQVMGVTRPLHSVSMICDGSGSPNKHNMLFTEKCGYVVPAGVFDEVIRPQRPRARSSRSIRAT